MKIKLLGAMFFVIIFAFSFCQEDKSSEYKRKIVGEWFSVEKRFLRDINLSEQEFQPPPPPFTFKVGYTFYENDSVEIKNGIFHYSPPALNKAGLGEIKFIGNKTKFKINGDNLEIINTNLNYRDARKILKISDDSLFLIERDTNFNGIETTYLQKFKKYKGLTDSTIEFDAIKLKETACYGNCPVCDIIIKNSGEVYFNGIRYCSRVGYYTSHISKEKFNELANNFKKINLSSLSNDFHVSCSDMPSAYIYFYKRGKLIKKIRDYGCAAPTELVCAYNQLGNLYHELTLEKIEDKLGEQFFENN